VFEEPPGVDVQLPRYVEHAYGDISSGM
jgi:hypothetical protein